MELSYYQLRDSYLEKWMPIWCHSVRLECNSCTLAIVVHATRARKIGEDIHLYMWKSRWECELETIWNALRNYHRERRDSHWARLHKDPYVMLQTLLWYQDSPIQLHDPRELALVAHWDWYFHNMDLYPWGNHEDSGTGWMRMRWEKLRYCRLALHQISR